MSIDALHPMPARAAVAREQLRAVGLAVRREAILAAALAAVATVAILWPYLTLRDAGMQDQMQFVLVPTTAGPLMFLALIVPLAVWKAEEPERRTYLWAMPVQRGWHQLAKVCAGWVWLMVALALFMVWAVAMTKATGGEIGVETFRRFIGADWDNRQPSDFVEIVIRTPAWQWLVPVTAVTMAYLFGSIVALTSNHPWRLLAGAWFAILCVTAVVNGIGWEGVASVLSKIVGGHDWYGMEVAFTGALNAREHLPGDFRTEGQWVQRPHLGAWLTATSLWLGLGVAGTLWAANRHREP